MEGSGKMVVTAVGVHSQNGIIMTLISGGKAETKEEKAKRKAARAEKKKAEAAERKRAKKTGNKATISPTDREYEIPPIGEIDKGDIELGDRAMVDEGPDKTNEKTVLQTKLTKLAVEIGYAG
jgi:Ca2+ transporting ATPase